MRKYAKSRLNYYRTPAKDVISQLESDRQGLSHTDALRRLEQFGPNTLEPPEHVSVFRKYARQFKDLMIVLLIICALFAFWSGDAATGVVLLALVLFNTLIGFSQEYKAERLMESLEKLLIAEAKTLRDGSLQEIDASELVPGDVVYIEEGDSVPADLRIIEENELSSNDFALTGESNPSRKFAHAISTDVELANRHNLLFMGTTIATGNGYGIVIGTGMQTELGRIASLSNKTQTEVSPLQREMNHIAAKVTKWTMALSIILLPLSMYFGLAFEGALLVAIGIASSVIPQGLPAEINTGLARAANKLAHARVLVKKLSAVEALGATSIICTDKTGTLTKNEMTVQDVMIGYNLYRVSGLGYQPTGKIFDAHNKVLSEKRLDNLKLFFATGVLASNASVHSPDEEHATWYTVGDPTEGALITLARKAGIETDTLLTESPEIKEFQFDSGRKLMSSVRKFGPKQKIYVFVKGAPESVLERCTQFTDQHGSRPLSTADRKLLQNQNMMWAQDARRNLAYAYRVLPAGTDINDLSMEDTEKNLTFLGLVSITDPLREEVAEAMHAAYDANIKVSVITGDFAPTAKAIAVKAGLGHRETPINVVSGTELRSLDNAQVVQLIARGSVIFSRVSPEDKLRIVELTKSSGKVVAVTGDGINDAPALKRADIGVAMGKTGTDVAKQSADIILLDDSFHTLVGAIEQGRTIYQNIKKATLSCFTSNAAELVVSMTSLVAFIWLDVPLALTIMQLLAIDMIAELFPIAALGWDKADGNVMDSKPRDPKDHILNRFTIIDLLWSGLLIGGLAFANYIFFFWRHGIPAAGADAIDPALYMQATALTYVTIVLCQLLNILQRRSEHGLFTRYQLHNKALAIALAFSVFSVVNIIYNPLIAPYFGSMPLDAIDWAFALLAAAIFVAVRELQRHADTHHSREEIIRLHNKSLKSAA